MGPGGSGKRYVADKSNLEDNLMTGTCRKRKYQVKESHALEKEDPLKAA